MKNWRSQLIRAALFVAVFSTLSAAQEPEAKVAQPPAQCGGALLRQPQPRSRKASVALFKDVIKTLWDNERLEHNLGRTVTTVTSLTLGN